MESVGPAKDRRLYQFKVTLRGVCPSIWRRVKVWEDYTLDQLHRVLQVAMGWENYHLYEFRIVGAMYRDPHPENEPEILNAKRTRICNVLSGIGAKFEYLYDFGDDWQHDLILEAILDPSQDALYPRCAGGERSCPPEDVGGIGGYEDYLRAMADPSHEEHEDMMAWRGPFDPEAFSIEKVNKLLEKNFARCGSERFQTRMLRNPRYHHKQSNFCRRSYPGPHLRRRNESASNRTKRFRWS